jgi:uncharacterized protein (TIGR03905 family)
LEKIAFTPVGVCAEKIYFTVDDGRVVRVEFVNGCEGNLQGIAALVEGMEVGEVIPVNAYVAGCPPKPEAIIDGVVKLLKSAGY